MKHIMYEGILLLVMYLTIHAIIMGDMHFTWLTIYIFSHKSQNSTGVVCDASEMICILHGFPCEMDFYLHDSANPTPVTCEEVRIRR